MVNQPTQSFATNNLNEVTKKYNTMLDEAPELEFDESLLLNQNIPLVKMQPKNDMEHVILDRDKLFNL